MHEAQGNPQDSNGSLRQRRHLPRTTRECPPPLFSLRRGTGPSLPVTLQERLPLDLQGTFRALSPSPPGPQSPEETTPVDALPSPSVPGKQQTQLLGADRPPMATPLMGVPSPQPRPHVADASRTPQPQEDAANFDCSNLANYLQVNQGIPVNLTLVLTAPRPTWHIVQGQPTLALVQP